MSYYGSIPATFEYLKGEEAFPFLIVTEAINLDAMISSEQRTNNYDTLEVGTGSLGFSPAFRILAFVCRFGALRIEGEVRRLREFQSQAAGGVSQREVLDQVMGIVAPGILPTDLTPAANRKEEPNFDLCMELRRRIIAQLGSGPNVPGWRPLVRQS
jgi:hypothetical protein